MFLPLTDIHMADTHRYIGRNHSAVRISLLTDDLYLVHGAKNVAEVLRASSLSVTKSMGLILTYCFGLSEEAAMAYFEDTSGAQKKPILGSNTKRHNRIYHRTQEIHLEGLLGNGLPPMMDRLENEMRAFASSLPVFGDWVEYPDLLAFFETTIGAIVIKIIFGGALLKQDPDFVSRLWKFDDVIMSLARRLPMIFAPRAYYLRFKLLQAIKKWHAYARACSAASVKDHNQDSDPYWGCRMIRDRYTALLQAKNHDDDSVASTDLGFIWA